MKVAHRVCLLVLCCSMFSVSASASHYSLSDVDIVPSKHVTTLYKLGITSTRTLLQKVLTHMERRAMAKLLGVKGSTVTAWAKLCDLLRVIGIGPTMARLFTAARVQSIQQLARQTPKGLYAKIAAANKKTKITDNLPGEGHLLDWIGQAKRLPVILRN